MSQCAVYPLDVTKTRLAVASAGTYRGITHVLYKTAAEEGVGALFKGLSVALLAIMPAAGIDLAVYNTLRVKYIEYASRQESAKQSTIQMPIYLALLFGAMSATCGAVTAYPLTLVRTR